ncbi:MAG TPA: bifunctional riboflavin kinase/FMN adenylyltransferase, partial [Terriglobales bacterium]
MQVFRELEEVPAQLGPTIVSVGNFDGVHVAHQAVVRHMAERAHAIGGKAVVVTFEPHPLRILRPDVAPRLLTPLEVKLQLLEQTGVDAVLVLPFSRDLSLMTAHDFAQQVLVDALHAREVHEGYNFHFGHKAQGNVETLSGFGREMGFDVYTYSEQTLRGH